MGDLFDLYGKRNREFIRGALMSILEYCPKPQQKEAMSEIIQDIAENPEEWDVNEIFETGWPKLSS